MSALSRSVLMLFLMPLAAVSYADKAGDALLQKCFEATTNASTLQASFTHQHKEKGQTRTQTGTLLLQKPNRAHIVVNSRKGQGSNVVINSDGSKFVTYTYADNAFAQEAADPTGGNVARNNINETKIFFFPDYLNRLRSMASGARIVGAVSVGNMTCKTLEVTGLPQKLKLYVGSDGIIRGMLVEGADFRDETHLTEVKIGASVGQTAFNWKPPKGAKTVAEVAASEAAQEQAAAQGRQAVSLLPVGKIAPDFTLPLATGGSMRLSQELKKNKVTLLNFWALFCVPCREELPHISKMAAQFHSQGFNVVSVNTAGDAPQAITKMFGKKQIKLRSLIDKGSVSGKYGIQAIPTNYVLDPNGKILATFEGFDEDGIRQALAKAGIK